MDRIYLDNIFGRLRFLALIRGWLCNTDGSESWQVTPESVSLCFLPSAPFIIAIYIHYSSEGRKAGAVIKTNRPRVRTPSRQNGGHSPSSLSINLLLDNCANLKSIQSSTFIDHQGK